MGARAADCRARRHCHNEGEVSSLQTIGVFVCWCGSNIAATVDVKAVAEAASHEPGVVFATDYQYMCSEGGQARIREAIREYSLTGIVICSRCV